MNTETVIHTGLNDFIMIDRILEVNASHIVGTSSFPNVPVYLGIESLAQLGAFHIRHLIDFTRHVFLMKITHCSLSARHFHKGEYMFFGNLSGQSNSAFSCRLRAERNKKTIIQGDFLYASVDYDRNFKKEILQRHYRKMFSCLQSDLKVG